MLFGLLFRCQWSTVRTRWKRPPVVTIMGHVDHGKTTLLDYLRKSKVAAGEAGGITQHIGAFSVRTGSSDDSSGCITFLDTPGHAAFSAIRARGAKVTDLIVLVVAAGDGVMGQTKEAIALAHDNNVPLIVAISKCDAFPPEAVEAVKAGLREVQVFPEEDGGDVQMVPVSGLTGAGVDGLLEAIQAEADMMDEGQLEADLEAPVQATLIEARQVRGIGHAGTVIVREGVLRVGTVLVGGEAWCRVRAMRDALGNPVAEALPSMPVEITGWHGPTSPEVGTLLLQVQGGEPAAEKLVEENLRVRREVEALDAVKVAEEREAVLDDKLWRIINREAKDPSAAPRFVHSYDEVTSSSSAASKVIQVPVVIKADVSGSVEAIQKMLGELPKAKAQINIISASVGPITQADVELAKASNAHLIAFNLPPARNLKNFPRQLLSYNIIYKLMDRVEELLVQAIPPVWKETRLGLAKVLQLFQLSGSADIVLGCRIEEGTVTRGAGPPLPPSPAGLPPAEHRVRILRKESDEPLTIPTLRIKTMRHGKKEIPSATKGMDCGILLDDGNIAAEIQPGDLIEVYQRIPSYDTLK